MFSTNQNDLSFLFANEKRAPKHHFKNLPKRPEKRRFLIISSTVSHPVTISVHSENHFQDHKSGINVGDVSWGRDMLVTGFKSNF